jgi:hypothetical protein
VTTYSKDRTKEEIRTLKREKQREYRSRPEIQERQARYLELHRDEKIKYDKDRQAKPEIKERRFDLQKRQMYGITAEEYKAKLVQQNYVCESCKKPEERIDYRSGKPFSLAVDHNHYTGEVRGLLCTKCNISLGLVDDKPEILVKYLAKYNGKMYP